MGVVDTLRYCLTELFPIYQKSHWTIKWWDNQMMYYIEDCQIFAQYDSSILQGSSGADDLGTYSFCQHIPTKKMAREQAEEIWV